MLNYNILPVNIKTPAEIALEICQRVKQRRLELNLTQEGLSSKAGLKLSTYRRFEHTGKISLEGLLKIAFVLDLIEDFELLFTTKKYSSFEEAINGKSKARKRGKKNV